MIAVQSSVWLAVSGKEILNISPDGVVIVKRGIGCSQVVVEKCRMIALLSLLCHLYEEL